MAPVIAVILECAPYYRDEDNDLVPGAAEASCRQQELGPASRTMEAINVISNWDLCTAAVFTCSRSCGGQAMPSASSESPGADRAPLAAQWCEELVVVVNEHSKDVI